MRAFERPNPAYNFDPAAEIGALRHYRDTEPSRDIPGSTGGHLLLATAPC